MWWNRLACTGTHTARHAKLSVSTRGLGLRDYGLGLSLGECVATRYLDLRGAGFGGSDCLRNFVFFEFGVRV